MKNKTVIIFIFFVVVFLPGVVHCQQDPLFTQYAYNKLAFNPGYAGSNERLSVDLITRIQWVGVKGAPRTISFNAHTPLKNNHIGIGLNAYRDELGPSVDYGAMASFAYRLLFRSTTLCFGIQAGFRYMDINWGLLNPKDQGDVALDGSVTNKAVPDIDFGIYYYGKRFYAGLSAKHLLQNQILISSTAPEDEMSFTKLQRNLYAMTGGVIPVTKSIDFIPSVLVKYLKDTPLQADFNINFLFNNVLSLGAAYRTEEALALMIQVHLGKGYSMGYSYDLWFNALKSQNSGSHEIRLGYEFDLFRRDRMLTPRYF